MLEGTLEKSMDFEFNLLAGDMWPDIHNHSQPKSVKGVVEWLPLSWSLYNCRYMQLDAIIIELQYMCAGYINFVQLGYDHPYNEETSEEFWPMMPWCTCFFSPNSTNASGSLTRYQGAAWWPLEVIDGMRFFWDDAEDNEPKSTSKPRSALAWGKGPLITSVRCLCVQIEPILSYLN